jgi:16S rRNA (adenine1518-N6/adenine1519-N6)-dimethyltransferase
MPKVDSTVLEFLPRRERNWNDTGQEFFRQVVRTSLAHRRKTLLNCLKGFLAQRQIDIIALQQLTLRAGIDLKRRGETLSLEEFDELTTIIDSFIVRK